MKALRRANPNEERIEDVLDAQIGKVLRISLMSDATCQALYFQNISTTTLVFVVLPSIQGGLCNSDYPVLSSSRMLVEGVH